MRDELTEKIQTFIAPFIEEISCELVELKLKKTQKLIIIDILTDKPNGGITIDECTLINKKIARGLEESEWFGDDFTVEVSSPGLDRPLQTKQDFKRVMGRNVRIHLMNAVAGKVEHHGAVTDVNDQEVLITNKDSVITIPFELISKAVQVIE